MAHERIEVDLPLAKVYEYLSDPIYFPHFFERVDRVNKVNSQTFEFSTKMNGKEFQWTTNVIDNLRNTRFAWITINGNLNQTRTLRLTQLDSGERTRGEFSLNNRTFYGDPDEKWAKFIKGLRAKKKKYLQRLKEEAEEDTFKQDADD